MSQATVNVHRDFVEASIEAPAEDLMHYGLLTFEYENTFSYKDIRKAARIYAEKVRDSLVVRDAAGTQLRGTLVSWALNPDSKDDDKQERLTNVWIDIKLRFDQSKKAPLKFVTFQHRDTQQTMILITRLGTTVRQAGHDDVLHRIVLTSGGNAETLEFDWETHASNDAGKSESREPIRVKDARSWLGDERFKTVHGILRPDSKGATLRVVVPLTISETWQPIRREKEALMSIEDQLNVIADWRKRLAKAVAAKLDGNTATVKVEDVTIIGPAASESSDKGKPHVLSFYAGRIVGTLRIDGVRDAKAIDLTWKLFNEAVPAARVLVIAGDDAIEYPVSGYSPELHWQRED